MRNKKAENQVKQAMEMHPMSEAAAPTESVLSSLKIDSVESLERHTHTYLVSEYKLVIRDGKQTVLKAAEYRCSTCLEVKV